MENLPIILLALACPIGMGLMMLFMGRRMGMGQSRDQASAPPAGSPPADPDEQLAVLLAERELIDAQIADAGQTKADGHKQEIRRALDAGRPEGS